MIILEDSRQQHGKHDHKNQWFKNNGIEIKRTKLLVGDYTLPADQSVCVDTKKDCMELYSNLIQDHERFRSECILAQECDIKLIILVENKSGITNIDELKTWKNPLMFKYWKAKKQGVKRKPPVSNINLIKIMNSMQRDYNVEFQFCSPEEAGQKLVNLLTIDKY